MNRLFKAITTIPEAYEAVEENKDIIVYLYYFKGGSNWFITEKDSNENQRLAFGYAVLNADLEMAELEYISIKELKELNIDLDFHFELTILKRIQSHLNEHYNIILLKKKLIQMNYH